MRSRLASRRAPPNHLPVATLPMRILTVIGNRPQFVKAAAVSRLLREAHEELIVHTGQHYDDELSRVFFEELGVPRARPRARRRRRARTPSRRRGSSAALEGVLEAAAPDMVLVYGDTNSTLAGALAAAQARRARSAHVEAGMRSFDRAMPEELNRVLTDHASDLLLCSTETADGEPRARGASPGEVDLVGDVMADVSLAFRPIAEERSTRARRSRPRARRVPAGHRPPRGQRGRPGAARAAGRAARGAARAGRPPAAPAHRGAAGGGRAAATGSTPAARSG